MNAFQRNTVSSELNRLSSALILGARFAAFNRIN